MECKNCLIELNENQNYCHDCGAKIIRNRLTFKNLWADFVEHFLNIDNTLLITIMHLFTKPEKVILGYINGQRKKYINPISYYGIALTITGLLYFLISKYFTGQLSMSWLAGEIAQSGEESFKTAIENQTIFSLIAIPLYAVISKFLFLGNKELNLTEHAILYLFALSQLSIVSFPFMVLLLILGFNFYALSYGLILILIIYISFCLTRIFKLSISSILFKVFLLFIVLIVLLILVALAQLGYAYFEGGIEGIKQLGKPK